MTRIDREKTRIYLKEAVKWAGHYQAQVVYCEDGTYLKECIKKEIYWNEQAEILQQRLWA